MNEVMQAKLAGAYTFCREVARAEAKNFYYAFRVLPQHKSDAMCAVYAFMRKADDLSDDESMSLEERRAAMAAWTEQWRAARTSGESNDPVFVALNDTQRRFGISDTLLEQLVAGTTLDLDPQPQGTKLLTIGGKTVQVYESFSALEHYCYLVASVVGLVCIRIFGYTDSRAEQLAIDTGTAFQLTNILRDVKEDAERGRVYLPEDKMAEYGVSLDRVFALCNGEEPQRPELELIMGLQGTAQRLYRRSDQLIPLLDKDSRAAMRVLVKIYHGLLNKVADEPEAVFHRRLSVPTSKKLAILGLGLLESIGARVL
ncbi:phytoene/squalene synthase family protein [Granulicella cerasi]|uniref:Phytoene/squalene synthase family protein n=1 Tax=Granulicella cerasi TaxID=741063 RepID=A0ABW1Z7B0_9BACT|nr:phytoene/squalene synthase family protein [Granulicella cerasi]